MNDCEDYINKLRIATTSNVNLYELQAEVAKERRNEMYMHSINIEPKFAQPKTINYENI